MRAYITRYALTVGIKEVVGELTHTPTMLSLNGPLFGYCHKPDWHTTRAEAIKRAEEMRKKKITSLRKQLTKLEAMNFKE